MLSPRASLGVALLSLQWWSWVGRRPEGDQDTHTINNEGHVSGEWLQEPFFLQGSKIWKSFISLSFYRPGGSVAQS